MVSFIMRKHLTAMRAMVQALIFLPRQNCLGCFSIAWSRHFLYRCFQVKITTDQWYSWKWTVASQSQDNVLLLHSVPKYFTHSSPRQEEWVENREAQGLFPCKTRNFVWNYQLHVETGTILPSSHIWVQVSSHTSVGLTGGTVSYQRPYLTSFNFPLMSRHSISPWAIKKDQLS